MNDFLNKLIQKQLSDDVIQIFEKQCAENAKKLYTRKLLIEKINNKESGFTELPLGDGWFKLVDDNL